jgi:hypothetical protein
VGLTRVAAVALGALMLFTGCRECALIDQVVALPPEDDQLQPLIDACTMHVPDGAPGCAVAPTSPGASSAAVDCGCVALCRRVLELIDQFPGSESLVSCHLRPPPDGGWATAVEVTYRPSTCQ